MRERCLWVNVLGFVVNASLYLKLLALAFIRCCFTTWIVSDVVTYQFHASF